MEHLYQLNPFVQALEPKINKFKGLHVNGAGKGIAWSSHLAKVWLRPRLGVVRYRSSLANGSCVLRASSGARNWKTLTLH